MDENVPQIPEKIFVNTALEERVARFKSKKSDNSIIGCSCIAIFAVLFAFVCWGMFAMYQSFTTPKEQKLIKKAFYNIKKDRWWLYSLYATTPYKIEFDELDISLWNDTIGYSNYCTAIDTQRERQKEQFTRAVQGGQGQIDFQNAKFIGIVEPAEFEESFTWYDSKTYSIKIKVNGKIIKTSNLTPKFVVAEWKSGEIIPRKHMKMMWLEFE